MWILLWQLFCLRVVCFLWDTGKTLLADNIPRKDYIVKNLSKACTLAVLTPNAIWTAYDVFVHGRWSAATFRVFGAVYCAHDIAGLLRMWKKLPSSTRMHHCSVVFMSFLSMFYVDYEDPTSLWRGIGVLGTVLRGAEQCRNAPPIEIVHHALIMLAAHGPALSVTMLTKGNRI